MVDDIRKVDVACAIIEHNGLVFAAQRSAVMSLPYKWEFPGGKIEADEQPEQCLKREILEELGTTVQILRPQPTSTYQYSEILVTLFPFVCSIVRDNINLHEHMNMIWLPAEKLPTLDWAEADLPVVYDYLAQLHQGGA